MVRGRGGGPWLGQGRGAMARGRGEVEPQHVHRVTTCNMSWQPTCTFLSR